MSYCTRCGSYIPQGETACPACGYDPEAEKAEQQQTHFTGGAAQATQSAPRPQQGEYHSQQGSYQTQTEEKPQTQAMTWAPWNQEEEKQEEENSCTGGEAQTGTPVSEELRRLSVLSYIGPLFLLPLLLHKDNEFIRYHANQGLCLLIFEMVTDMIFGGVLHLASMLFSIYCVVLGAKAAAAGKTVELPLIGRWRILKGKY